jgi:hypothetical protein
MRQGNGGRDHKHYWHRGEVTTFHDYVERAVGAPDGYCRSNTGKQLFQLSGPAEGDQDKQVEISTFVPYPDISDCRDHACYSLFDLQA